MTTPTPTQQPKKLLTPALLSALAALVVLAVVTVVVVATGGDDAPPSGSGGEGSSSAAPSSSEKSPSSSSAPAEPDFNTVVDDELGVQYTFAMDGYDEFDWGGPADVTAGIVDLHSAVSYAACTYDAGSDVLYGLLTSDETGLAQAAKIAAVDMSKSVWAGSGEATATEPTSPSKKITDDGVVGQLVEIDSTRVNGEADECGTTTSHIASYAFENAKGQVVVMISSHRTDGEAVKDADGFTDDVTMTFQSVALV